LGSGLICICGFETSVIIDHNLHARTDHAAAILEMLITVHPEANGLWQIFDEKAQGERNRLIDTTACKRYAARAKATLEKRVEQERK